MRLLTSALAVCLLLAGCSGDDKPEPDATLTPSISGVQAFPGLKHDHLTKKAQYPHEYAQVPPVGGGHAPIWLACDVYTAPVPNEFAVHSMEHGGIWITYRPGLAAAQVATLAALQPTNREYVLVSPYDGLPSPVVVTTWGLQLKLDSATDPRLRDFITTYAGGNQGGEQGATCRKNGVTPAQAEQLLADLDD